MAITPDDKKISQFPEVTPTESMFIPLIDLDQANPALRNVRATVAAILALVPASGGTVTDFSAGDLSPLFTTSVAASTSTPALSFSLSAHSANQVFAGPTAGGAADPTFRALVAADIPNLTSIYQPLDADLTAIAALGTTAYGRGFLTQADASAARTYIGAGTGNGTVTSVNLTQPAAGITVAGGPITTTGSITLALADDLAALEALSGTDTIYYRSGVSTWTPVTIGSNLLFTGGTLSASAPGTGTVTSFSAGNLSPLFTSNVATATTTPALTFTLSNQNANLVFAGPTNGAAAAPTFRSLVAADIPALAAPGSNTQVIIKNAGAFGAASTLTYSGSVLHQNRGNIQTTPTEAIAIDNLTPSTNVVGIQYSPYLSWNGSSWNTDSTVSTPASFRAYITPDSGGEGQAVWRLEGGDFSFPLTYASVNGLLTAERVEANQSIGAPSITYGGNSIVIDDGGGNMQFVVAVNSEFNNGGDITFNPQDGLGSGVVDINGGLTLTNALGLAYGGTGSALTDPGADRIMFWDDSAGVVTWLTAGTGLTITGTTITATGTGGTVTSFSAGNLSPIFTSNVATATTTPALTFTLSTQTANFVFAGPTGGGAAAPTFRALVAADIPDLSGVYQPLDADLTAIAALAPTNNDIIQRKSGAWTNRSVTQYWNDILSTVSTPYTSLPFSMGSGNILGRFSILPGSVEELTVGSSLLLGAGSINTIQDIRTTATPQFLRLGLGTAASGSVQLNLLSGGQHAILASSGDVTAGGASYIQYNDTNGQVANFGFAGLSNAFDIGTFISGGFVRILAGVGSLAATFTTTGIQGAIGATTPSTGAFTAITNGSTSLMATSVALSNGAGVGLGTLTNAPSAGDPTKWIAINDNGTTRYIPTWQ